MATLPTNLKDDILDASVNQRRRYNMITNPDGTVEFEDVTAYSQVGSEYGAGLINETNKQINGKVDDSKIVRDLKTIGAMTQEGFIPDALALKEVNESLEELKNNTKIKSGRTSVTFSNNQATLAHNCGFSDKNYSLLFTFTDGDFFSVRSTPIDGNTCTIRGRNFSGADIQDLSGTHTVTWIACK